MRCERGRTFSWLQRRIRPLLISTIGTQPAEPLSHARAITATVGSVLDILPNGPIVVLVGTVARPATTWREDALAAFAPNSAFPMLLWIDILPKQTVRGVVVATHGLRKFCRFDITMAEGSSPRAEVVHKVARLAAQAIGRNDPTTEFNTLDHSAAELMPLSHALSERIDVLAQLEPPPFRSPFGQRPLPRLPRRKAPRGLPRPPRIFLIAERHAEKALDIEFENLDVLLAGSSHLGPPEGRRGFPTYAEIPRIVLGKSKNRRPPRDLEQYHAYWLVSDRLKALFEAIDPEAFAFQDCNVRQRDGSIGPRFWLCDVVRTLDAIDEETAKVIDHYFQRIGKRVSHVSMREELSFQPSKIGDAHIFRTPYSWTNIFCDQHLKDACSASGLKVRFEPTFE